MIKAIVNPAASGGRVAQQWPQIAQALGQRGLVFDADLTTHPRHATDLARAALAAGYREFISVGGDGTFNEVLNGIIVGGMPHPQVTMSVIPGGTGSDWARVLGIPRSPLDAAKSVFTQPIRAVDVGEISCYRDGQPEKRYFANVAGLGFDGEVCIRVNRSSKRLTGTLPYVTSLVLTLFSYRNKDVELVVDGQCIRGRFNSIAICSGQYYGGGMHIAPQAVVDDGLFDVVILKDLNRLELLANLPRVYNGTHLTHPKVQSLRGSQVSVTSEQRTYIQAEGELVGETPAQIRMIPASLRLSA